MRSLLLVLFLLSVFAYGSGVRAQAPAAAAATVPDDADITPARVSGEVVAFDMKAKQMTLKTGAGNLVVVSLDDKTSYFRVPPGEVTLEKAVTIQPDGIGVGDRVIARGRVAADRKSVPARQLIVMTKADLKVKDERDREEWRRRGVAGRVEEIRPAERVLVLSAASGGSQTLTLKVKEGAPVRRFAPGAVKFADARPSSFEDLKAGDFIRALGDKSADGTRFDAEEVVAGSFRMVGGPVKAVDAASGEVTLSSLEDGSPVTVVVTGDSMLRRVPPDVVALIARRKAAGEAGVGRPAEGQSNADIQETIERLPQMAFSEIKVGDTVVVSTITGSDSARLTAVILATGLEQLLPRAQPTRSRLKGTTGSTSLGLPSGVLDGGLGGP